MSETVIVDSGGANLASLTHAFARLGARTRVSADAATIAAARRVVLPGVGAARPTMERLEALGLTPVLRALTQPVLGICLGMQLLFAHSAEGSTPCLAVLPQDVQPLTSAPGHPVPHMGWNELTSLKPDPLLDGITEGEYAYFVHSYAVPVAPQTLASTAYGGLLSAVVRSQNFWGTQFHPERSAATGARVLDNFLRL